MTELPAYSGLCVRCPKCGAVGAGATYQHAFPAADENAAPVDAGVYHRQYERYATRPGGPGESMLRRCQTCGYQWAEACAGSRDANPILTPATVAETLAAMLDSYRWDVWRHEGWWDDLLVTDPPGTRTYLIGLREGRDPVHFDDIAQLKRAAGLLGGQVTPVLLTSQPVPGKIAELGVQVLQATGSEQQTAETALRFLRQEEG